ncbi:Glutamyl-tRNA(Gln) amidotransferase subunit A [Micromonospora sp. MH33]|uniref:amidase n=1 Tax=Micromonospora sp. MH33 TaxID=1945509 RepID=UPI000D148493|nr:amidase [Micromonospora sp. MH33]PSK67353.1 Glutamyl-tRNA(Gln) amidotransferase subunit A [Micromonospora sp. MH33]
MQLPDLSLTELAAAIQARELSPVEVVDAVLERAERTEPQLNAYSAIDADGAREAAHAAERALAAGRDAGPLAGIPVGIKDLIDIEGRPTGAGSGVRDGHRAEKDSAVVSSLRDAGAIMLGKTHTHEFAYGLITPQTRNAVNGDRVAGGSSGGSAAAVAAGSATFALGTDTGGSIRVPAALNGVVGLKPTYDLVPRQGVTSLSWSLDHVGPITRTVADAALALSALTGRRAALHTDLRGIRVGVPRNYYFDRLDPQVERAVLAAVDKLAALGATLVDVDIPMTRYLVPAQSVIMLAEASAYHEHTLRAAADLYGEDVRGLLEAGGLLGAGEYLRGQRARTLVREAWSGLFTGVDVLAAPTVPITAVPIGQESIVWPNGEVESVTDAYVRLCAPANLTGFPALSVPVGFDEDALPIGLQLIGAPFTEDVLLRVGLAHEEATG